ncbi:MAG: nucleotide exchange factor GrpE [Pseudomonadota bacterium]
MARSPFDSDHMSRAELKRAADEILAEEGRSVDGFDDPEALEPDDLYDEDLDTGPDERDKSKADPMLLLRQEITLKDAEIESLKEQLLRLQADMENLRRRTQREVSDAKAYAVSNFARDMLEVSDNLGRAVGAVPEEEAENAAVKALVEGVEMTDRSMISAMERHGVKRLEPKGEKFDPNFHQAMFEMPNTEVPHNSVVEVVQTGYSIGSRVLRPAMVGVAKGGPKFEAKSDDAASPDVAS